MMNGAALLFTCLKPAHDLAGVYRFVYNSQGYHTLLYAASDPYMSGQNEAVFYEKGSLRVQSLQGYAAASGQKERLLYFTEDRDDKNLGRFTHAQLLYTNIPSWLWQFNINHWLDRSNVYSVYEVELK
jgi:hypothetical protein